MKSLALKSRPGRGENAVSSVRIDGGIAPRRSPQHIGNFGEKARERLLLVRVLWALRQHGVEVARTVQNIAIHLCSPAYRNSRPERESPGSARSAGPAGRNRLQPDGSPRPDCAQSARKRFSTRRKILSPALRLTVRGNSPRRLHDRRSQLVVAGSPCRSRRFLVLELAYAFALALPIGVINQNAGARVTPLQQHVADALLLLVLTDKGRGCIRCWCRNPGR